MVLDLILEVYDPLLFVGLGTNRSLVFAQCFTQSLVIEVVKPQCSIVASKQDMVVFLIDAHILHVGTKVLESGSCQYVEFVLIDLVNSHLYLLAVLR